MLEDCRFHATQVLTSMEEAGLSNSAAENEKYTISCILKVLECLYVGLR